MPSRLPRLVFAGTPAFAATILQVILYHDRSSIAGVLTQPDRPSGRGRQLHASAVKRLALEHSVPVLQPARLRDSSDLDPLAQLAPEVLVVAAFGLLLPRAVLDLPPLGCINVHASLLPRWRGAAPIERAIEAGDPETGITIMHMDEGLDTGPMLARHHCPIMATDTGESLRQRLACLGAEEVLKVLRLLRERKLPEVAQDGTGAIYASKLRREEAVIDWRADATVIERRVRAFNPSNVCHTTAGGETLRVWRAEAAVASEGTAPGTLLRVDRRGILVACGTGALLLTELQLSGGRPLDAAALLNGRGLLFAPGSRLG